MANDLGISEEEAHEIMLNSKILEDKETLHYQIHADLARHGLPFETVYQKILNHRDECVYYTLL
jgi:hypothetical protein